MWDLIVSVPDHCLSFYFNGSKFLESGKSSFIFLHVHSHIDEVNYVHILQ